MAGATVGSGICAYFRTSSMLQAQANGSAGQEHAVDRWCEYQDIDPASIVRFKDDGWRGGTTERPAFQNMMAAIRRGGIGTLVAYSLSRLGRNTRDLLDIVSELREREVRVVFCKEQMDLGTATGRFFLTVLSAMAELEAETIRERMRSGIQAKMAAGIPWGGARVKVNKSGTTRGCTRFTREELVALEGRRVAGEKVTDLAVAAGIPPNHLYAKLKRVRV